DAAPQDLFLFERWYFFLMAIAGKTRQLDTLHIARQWNSPGSAGGANEARIGDWFGRMLAPSWSRDFTALVHAASAALAAKDNLPSDEARRRIVNAYRTWVTPHLLADVAAEPTVTLGMALGMGLFRRLLRLSSGNALRRAARTIYRRTPWVSVEAIYGTEWRTRRVSGAAEAFRPVQEFLAKSSTDG
ncbi:MAG: hypothetical protein HY824_13615, partial [Acidobacteria bacterium]|nr:hypothetical protein [Acidobacteriota bacterium]